MQSLSTRATLLDIVLHTPEPLAENVTGTLSRFVDAHSEHDHN